MNIINAGPRGASTGTVHTLLRRWSPRNSDHDYAETLCHQYMRYPILGEKRTGGAGGKRALNVADREVNCLNCLKQR